METIGVAHKLDAVTRTCDIRIKELAPFSKMLITEPVRKGLYQAGFVYPTVIQATAIPVGKSGMDLLVQSKSGTGKTLIFCLVVLDSYKNEVREPQSLIVAPTREVAVQIQQILNEIGKFCADFKAVCVIGGLDVAEDRMRLQGAKAVVGTPGRILHLIQSEMLNTSQIRLLVLDEADKIYSNTFRQDLEKIRKFLPYRKQIIACSATFVNNLDQDLAKMMRNPLLVSTEERATLLLGIKQFVYELTEQKTSILEMQLKLDALRHIFGRVAFKQCIIFAGSQSRAESYSNYLQKDGWPCELIYGAQDQKTRLEQFRKFREFKTRILISTDLMSRGVDSEHTNMVINLELPVDSVTYLHRIGRAGRFGSHGVAISFLASVKDHQIFKKLVSEVGTGMKALKFPARTTGDKQQRDVWNFDAFEDDIKYFGLYLPEPTAKAPLATHDNISLSASLSINRENFRNNNTSSLEQSSINTDTFLINSKDSELPKLTDFSKAPDNCPQNELISPLPIQSDNQNTQCESNDSTHQLITSNTIDDASSIAADSFQSSQQDISRYPSVLMQKSAIPTLVEFLVDHQIYQDTHTKQNQDLFDAYTEEVLNDGNEISENEVTVDGPVLTSIQLAQLKSMLIDKPSHVSPVKGNIDLYSDFDNFNEEDHSISQFKDIDKQTFILSVSTPPIRQVSLEELNKNSSDLCTATDEITVTTESIEANKEPKHFPSPAHNQIPSFPGCIANMVPGQSKQQTMQEQKQILSINVTAHIEIPPHQSSQNSISPFVSAMENHGEAPPSSTESSEATLSNDGGPIQLFDSETESSGGNSSGFDEKTSTSGSSGIVTSEHDSNVLQRQMEHYETSSEEDEDDNTYEVDDDNNGSDHYFGIDKDKVLEGDPTDEDIFSRPVVHHNYLSNTVNHNSDSTLNLTYQTAYSRWVDLYWNQMTSIQEYVNFFAFTRQ